MSMTIDPFSLMLENVSSCAAIEKVLEEHDRRTGSDITSTFMNFVKTQDIVTYREEMITETELCLILAFWAASWSLQAHGRCFGDKG